MKKIVKVTFILMFILGLICGMLIGFIRPFVQENFINFTSLLIAYSMIIGSFGIVYVIVCNNKYVA
jgi:hypothetical protein